MILWVLHVMGEGERKETLLICVGSFVCYDEWRYVLVEGSLRLEEKRA